MSARFQMRTMLLRSSTVCGVAFGVSGELIDCGEHDVVIRLELGAEALLPPQEQSARARRARARRARTRGWA